ncbi:DUF4862 family protein [Alteromonadaceae bacterium BrNp21-10]|nr:DUF4862 family protein [Alteromonadaceae bacterium BrNp21-10]
MRYFVGAYATSPNAFGWDPELETRYYQQLKSIPSIKGLEHPFTGTLHPNDDDWFLANIDSNWQYVFTCVPGNMGALSKNPHFGIASDDDAGRAQALAFMQKARDAIAKLNGHLGRQAVKAIEIQTAPNRSNASGSKAALNASLQTMLQWDWQGAQLVIEHCDTLVDGQKPAKGFLTLEDEIAVLTEINGQTETPIGMVMNWGRSVIETRSIEGAIEHTQLIKQAGLLSGLMFSGVSDQDTEYGAWSDSHMPPAPSASVQFGAEHSLMTEQQIQRSLAAGDGNNLDIMGIKLGIRPKDTSLEDRIGYIRDALGILDRSL